LKGLKFMPVRQIAASLLFLTIAGCAGDPPPPPPVNMENFESIQKKQAEVQRKEYGSEATKNLK